MLRILLLTISFINLTVVFGTLELVIGFQEITRIMGTTTNLKNVRAIAFEHTTSIKYGNPNCDYWDKTTVDLKQEYTTSPDSCHDLCKKTVSCTHYTWNPYITAKSCFMKSYTKDIKTEYTAWWSLHGYFNIFCGKV